MWRILYNGSMKYETFSEYCNRLKKLKIKRLGSGAYSTVYQHPTHQNIAVKIVFDDPSYIKYAKYCMSKPDNPYLPKIYSIHKVHFYDGVRYFVFLEKLKPSKASEVQNFAKKLFGETYFTDVRYHEWEDLAKETSDPQLKELAKILYNLEAEDIHYGNVMKRDNQLVFTDPVAS